MKNTITKGLVFVLILLVFSSGVAYAVVSIDNANIPSNKNIINITKNTTKNESFKNPIEIRPINATNNFTNVTSINATSINLTNDTMPLNATKNVTNPFIELRERL